MKDDPPSGAGPNRPSSGILGCIVNVRPYKPEDTPLLRASLRKQFTPSTQLTTRGNNLRLGLPILPTWNTGAGVSASGLLLLPNMIPKLLVLLHSNQMEI